MAEQEDGSDFRPSGEMLTAHLLALLKDWSGYGYELAKKLERDGFTGYNSGSLYRTLRQMERSGLITSLWDTSATGPAKRIYSMTGAGSLFLRNWLKMVDMHKSMLEHFLGISERDDSRPRSDQDGPVRQANDKTSASAEGSAEKPEKPKTRKTAAGKSVGKAAEWKSRVAKKGEQGGALPQAPGRKAGGAAAVKGKKDAAGNNASKGKNELPKKSRDKAASVSNKSSKTAGRASGASSKTQAKVRSPRNNNMADSPAKSSPSK